MIKIYKDTESMFINFLDSLWNILDIIVNYWEDDEWNDYNK